MMRIMMIILIMTVVTGNMSSLLIDDLIVFDELTNRTYMQATIIGQTGFSRVDRTNFQMTKDNYQLVTFTNFEFCDRKGRVTNLQLNWPHADKRIDSLIQYDPEHYPLRIEFRINSLDPQIFDLSWSPDHQVKSIFEVMTTNRQLRSVTRYNTKHQVTELTWHHPDPWFTTFRYEYDSSNNLVSISDCNIERLNFQKLWDYRYQYSDGLLVSVEKAGQNSKTGYGYSLYLTNIWADKRLLSSISYNDQQEFVRTNYLADHSFFNKHYQLKYIHYPSLEIITRLNSQSNTVYYQKKFISGELSNLVDFEYNIIYK